MKTSICMWLTNGNFVSCKVSENHDQGQSIYSLKEGGKKKKK